MGSMDSKENKCGEIVSLAPAANKPGHCSHSSPVIWMLCLGSACSDDQCLSLA